MLHGHNIQFGRGKSNALLAWPLIVSPEWHSLLLSVIDGIHHSPVGCSVDCVIPSLLVAISSV